LAASSVASEKQSMPPDRIESNNLRNEDFFLSASQFAPFTDPNPRLYRNSHNCGNKKETSCSICSSSLSARFYADRRVRDSRNSTHD